MATEYVKNQPKFDYDYSKFNGRRKELNYTDDAFAKDMGIAPPTFSQKINNISEFKQSEMIKAMELMQEPLDNLRLFFFCHKTSENQSN
ncbi:MAG: DUF739 family protein [Eubacterium sp.]|nr:DUF739 family protein [Eubacterium sp.]